MGPWAACSVAGLRWTRLDEPGVVDWVRCTNELTVPALRRVGVDTADRLVRVGDEVGRAGAGTGALTCSMCSPPLMMVYSRRAELQTYTRWTPVASSWIARRSMSSMSLSSTAAMICRITSSIGSTGPGRARRIVSARSAVRVRIMVVAT